MVETAVERFTNLDIATIYISRTCNECDVRGAYETRRKNLLQREREREREREGEGGRDSSLSFYSERFTAAAAKTRLLTSRINSERDETMERCEEESYTPRLHLPR